jgi:hypothetical protein
LDLVLVHAELAGLRQMILQAGLAVPGHSGRDANQFGRDGIYT